MMRKRIIDAARDLSDRSAQVELWFGRRVGEISSPSEMVCALIDDAFLKGFLAENDDQLTRDQKERAAKLIEAIDRLPMNAFATCDPEEVLDHPLWSDVRVAATDFVKSWMVAK